MRREAEEIAVDLDAASERERIKVFKALAPHLARELAHWWEWSRSRPYRQGWYHRPYRSSDAARTRPARWATLSTLIHHATHYPQPIEWHATWLIHFSNDLALGELLASSADAGNDTVRRTLVESVTGAHPTAGPSKPAYLALLAVRDRDAWDVVVQQLLAAARAEGLRQTILETADQAHPDALAYVLEVVVVNDLVRFSSSIRTLSTWVGEELTTENSSEVAAAFAALARFTRRPPSIGDLGSAAPIEVFLGLWALAARDVDIAVAAAASLVHDADPVRRLAATRVLVDLHDPAAADPLTVALADADLRVFASALSAWPVRRGEAYGVMPFTEGIRSTLQLRVDQLGDAQKADTGISVPRMVEVSRPHVVDVLAAYSGDAEIDLEGASAEARRAAAIRYGKNPSQYRAQLLTLALDVSQSVRWEARRALDLETITTEEALTLEQALTRNATDVRKTALRLLLRQSPENLEASVKRLRAGKPTQRRAADELGAISGPANEESVAGQPDAPASAAAARSGRGGVAETTQDVDDRPPLLRFGVEDRTPAVRPVAPLRSRWAEYHPGARRIWQSLGAWLAEHANVEVQTRRGVELLANITSIGLNGDGSMPVAELIDPWWERIRPGLVDGGVELVLLRLLRADQERMGMRVLGDIGRDRGDLTGSLRLELIEHLARREWRKSWAEPVLDLIALAASELSTDRLIHPGTVQFDDHRERVGKDGREGGPLFLGAPDYLDPAALDDKQLDRLWRMLRFVDEPEGAVDQWTAPKVELRQPSSWGAVDQYVDQPFRFRPPLKVVLEAFDRGLATRADLVDHVFTRPALRCEPRAAERNPLEAFSGIVSAQPATQAVVEGMQRAVVELELLRGDHETPYSTMAMSLERATGSETLAAVLRALGRRPFVRTRLYAHERESVFSHLVRIHHPASDESAESIARAFAGSQIPESRVIETAMFAPQWAELFEQHLGWPGFADAVWWVHAHTPVDTYDISAVIRAERSREINQRTPVSFEDRERGCADAEWFHRLHADLGDDRLDRVLKAAKYASKAGEQKQAELFAHALRGRVSEDELLARMHDKRHQDAVRAYGLLPLNGERGQLLRRYEVLRAFVSTGKTTGPQRRATETAAVHTALENLARTAGYRDPQRLIWAMEARAGEDLSRGAVTAVDDDLTVSLTIDDFGMPEVAVDRAGKSLATVPAKSRKVEGIAALTSRARDLKKQAQRVRVSLEAACVLGDVIDAGELALLQAHPILGRMLSDVVMVDAEGRVGFLSSGGDELVRADDFAFRPAGGLRIAHPLDLLASGDWPELQHAVMTRGRPQPFKQVFRELYVLNENEKTEQGISSRRYVGHQLSSRRAAGVFISRGWVREYGFGYERTFHNEKVTAFCNMSGGWGTAAEVEEAAVDDVRFGHAGSYRALPLADVPPRVFSETMRDLDLVVSVAHESGVDPESSEASIEMRRRLVDETCGLLGLQNVEVDGHHARVKGALGTYSVHLGSGIVHRIPGNTLFIIPVSAQHRGRVFLPFVDDDPRTAEIVSKVVMLSRDSKITDPTILSQIVR
ncbi:MULTISPECIES: DUF4132 domain-containing protein [unclassified Microbacterium]|uniref:DUF4132 domain-containing protein n=1 Tax=unclassified Microbacterium TaxID=2609290 RepID=UPI0011C38B80|nr:MULTISPECIES: DUF4132 domain-containing protein [unclassified Microbacterium]MBT2485177.1 DUF4132 domain-containing protein [Microbacterium sp. ISL-108]